MKCALVFVAACSSSKPAATVDAALLEILIVAGRIVTRAVGSASAQLSMTFEHQ